MAQQFLPPSSPSDYLHPDAAAAAAADEGPAPTTSSRSRARPCYTARERRWAVVLYAATTSLLFADQNLLAPNLSAAAAEFGFTDSERDSKLGGNIALAFFLLGAPASFLVGCLADVLPRAPLFALTVCVGEGSCLATYWTRTYAQLFVTRALTGVSVGGALPLISSVLGDLYEAKDRPAVMAAVGVGTGVGIAFGQGVAGFVGPRYGWRLPFLIVSIPALVCGILVLFTVRDPERGGSERALLQPRREESGVGRIEMEQIDGMSKSKTDCNPCGERDGARTMERNTPNCDTTRTDAIDEGKGDEAGSSADLRRNSLNAIDCFREDEDACSESSESGSILRRGKKTCGDITAQLTDWRSWAFHCRTLKSLLRCKSVLLILLQGAPGCLPWGVVNTYLNDYLSTDRGMTVEKATSVILVFGFGNFLGLLAGGAGGNLLYRKDPRFPPCFAGFMAIIGCFPMWLMINTVRETTPIPVVCIFSVVAGLCSGVTGPIVKATLQNVTLPNTRGQAFALQNTFDDFGRGLGPVFVAMLITSMGGRTAAFNVGVCGWILCGFFNWLLFFTIEKDEEAVHEQLLETLHRVSSISDTDPDSDPLLNGSTQRPHQDASQSKLIV